jgi:hypothetical protein
MRCGVLVGGDTGEVVADSGLLVEYCSPRFGVGVERRVGAVGGGGQASCWVLRQPGHGRRWALVAGLLTRTCAGGRTGPWWVEAFTVGVGLVLVENCTVDASIFFVVKLLRAYGGCLGTRSR